MINKDPLKKGSLFIDESNKMKIGGKILKNEKYKYKKLNSTLKYIFLLVFILIVMVLCSCGCQKKAETSDIIIPENHADVEEVEELNPYDFVLAFAGDINFDENWSTIEYYKTTKNGIYDCISPELMQNMRDADIMCINNEFSYSTNGVSHNMDEAVSPVYV